MSYAAPFVAVSLSFCLVAGSLTLHLAERSNDLESSAVECYREVAMMGNSACEKAVAAKAKALQATASALMPKS